MSKYVCMYHDKTNLNGVLTMSLAYQTQRLEISVWSKVLDVKEF